MKSGLTQAELAMRLRKSQSYVSKYERGERRIDVIELFEILHAMKADSIRFVIDLQRNIYKSI
ncbi:helix-turn-helix domain-containing protein [Caulobacter radicis]